MFSEEDSVLNTQNHSTMSIKPNAMMNHTQKPFIVAQRCTYTKMTNASSNQSQVQT